MMLFQEVRMTDLDSDLKSNAQKRQLSPRKKLYWGTSAGGVLLGIAIGYLLKSGQVESGTTGTGLFTQAQNLSSDSAMLAAILWAAGLTAMFALCHRALDEQEEHAVLWASTIAWYFTLIIIPAWWILNRGNIAPEVNSILVIAAAIILQTVIWAWKKYV
jgi:hypothetical protein